ncbi:MAG TPA: thioredoxin family protein [Myxococcota bacterium]|nr:thioredoxin family protein [Myxococcota bacterium]
MTRPPIVSREEWLEARRAHLANEKRLTRLQEELAAERRRLPWVKLDKTYTFDGPNGKETLGELFAGRRQLIVNHFMFGPGWAEGCVGCSFGADHVDAALPHLLQRDVSYVAVSRAPLEDIERFQKRMGWRFKWLSSYGSDFNFDFHVSFTKEELARGRVFYNFEEQPLPYPTEELQGTSVFFKDDAGDVFHTYSSYARGGENVLVTYACLDITPLGRDEDNGPTKSLADWVKHHDKYEIGPSAKPACH